MLIYQILFAVFALSIPITGLVVVVRLIWCAYQSLRASHIKFAGFSVLAIACLAGLFVALALVWFGYGVAHSRKDIWTDLTMIVLTGLLFYATSFGLWRLAKHFQSVLSRHPSRDALERTGVPPAAQR